MHRIDGPGATVDNKFTDGDPVGGVQATVVTDDWLNDIQENLMALLVAAGVPPTKGRAQDLLDSVKGRLIGVQTFSASGTYTPTSGTKSIVVEVLGGGGGGGGSALTTAGQASAGSGGSSGSYGKGKISSGFSGVSIVVGQGGVGATGFVNGSNGGSSSFGVAITAAGGIGGRGGDAGAPPGMNTAAVPGAIATGGSILNTQGNAGGNGFSTGTTAVIGGYGAASVFGGASPGSNGNGIVGGAPGAGGSGGARPQSNAAATGGNGANGIVIVWEYA